MEDNFVCSAIIVLCFATIALLPIKKKKESLSATVEFPLEQANCLRGVMAVLIVLTHTHNYFKSIGLLRIFNPFGYIGVSLFFYYSGYGVVKKTWKDEKYLDEFWRKRISKLFIPYIIATIIHVVVLFVVTPEQRPSLFRILLSFTSLKRILPYSWYVFIILLWYILWYCIAKMCKDPQKCLDIVAVVFLAYYTICTILDVNVFYFKSVSVLIMFVF